MWWDPRGAYFMGGGGAPQAGYGPSASLGLQGVISPWDREPPILGRPCAHLLGGPFLSAYPCVWGQGAGASDGCAARSLEVFLSEHMENPAQTHFPTVLPRFCSEALSTGEDRPCEVCTVPPRCPRSRAPGRAGRLVQKTQGPGWGSGCASECPPSVLFRKADNSNSPPGIKEGTSG